MFRSALICGLLAWSAAAQAQSYPTPTFQSVITANDVQFYGAKCDGTTDDSAALNAAATAVKNAGGVLRIPNAVCYSSVALNFGVISIVGAVPLNPTNPFIGAMISCNASIAAPCVTVGTLLGGTNRGASIRDMVFGFNGTPIAGDSALQIQGFNTVLDKTLASNAWDGYLFSSGIVAHATWLYTRGIFNNHIVQNSFPEVYIVNARFGMNGGGDPSNSNAFFGITGNDPNTLTCVACQLNLGGRAPKYVYDFYGLTAQNNGIYLLSDSLIDMGEQSNFTAVIHSDGTGTCFRCMWKGVTIVGTTTKPFFALGSVTSMNQSSFTDSNFFVGSFTLPHIGYTGLRLANLYVSGPITLDGSGAQAAVSNVLSAAAFTVQGSWSYLSLNGVLGGSYTDAAATGNIYATNTPITNWTPQLQFGGANVGMTQTTSYGKASRQSDGTVKQVFGVGLSALGSSTGAPQIIGAPYACSNFGLGQIDMGPIYPVNMTGLTSPLFAVGAAGLAAINIKGTAATGLSNLTNTNFTNTSSVAGTAVCNPL